MDLEAKWNAAVVAYAKKIRTAARASKNYVPGYDTEDMEQEFFIVLFKVVQSYDPDNGASFNTFFWQSIRNRISDMRRAQEQPKRKGSTITLEDEAVQYAVNQRISHASAEDEVMGRITVVAKYHRHIKLEAQYLKDELKRRRESGRKRKLA